MPTARLRSSLAALAVAALVTGCGGSPSDDALTELEAGADDGGTTSATDEGEDTADGTGGDDGDGAGDDAGDGDDSADGDAVPAVDLAAATAERCDGREDEAFIEVLSPAPDATVAGTFEVVGCGNTYEATYLWRLEQDGTELDGGFGTMTCGTGCVGTFTQEITTDATGPVTLVLYEESAQDGSAVNVVEVSLTVG